MALIFDSLVSVNEGKTEYLKKYGFEPDAEETVDKYWNIIRSRVSSPENNIDWWIKKPFADFKKFVDEFDTRKRSVRRSDAHAEAAKKAGAELLKTSNGYEIWYVPTYEASVELGRFYRGKSSHWCISTDDPQYFNYNYSDNEFIFLISVTDREPDDWFKVAIQLDCEAVDPAAWDLYDHTIDVDSDEFVESDCGKAYLEAVDIYDGDLEKFDRKRVKRELAEKRVADEKWMRENVFKFGCALISYSPEKAVVEFDFGSLEPLFADDSISYDTFSAVENGDSVYDYDNIEPSFDISLKSSSAFNDTFATEAERRGIPFRLTWDDIEKCSYDSDELPENIPERVAEIVKDMLYDDFYEGNSYSSVYVDCKRIGDEREMLDALDSELNSKLHGTRQYSETLKSMCVKSELSHKDLVNMAITADGRMDAAECLLTDPYDGEIYDENKIKVDEPYYGFDGFDDDMMTEACKSFAKRLAAELTKQSDLPGQMMLDFGTDVIDNPTNMDETEYFMEYV